MEEKSFYDFKNFRLDPEERVLLHDGKPISITPKVFDLLKVLVENRGRVIEKEELMAEIWKGSFVEESNLAFNIRQLRKALDDDARQPTFIETVPKRGYRFIAEVREIVGENGSNNGAQQTISQPVEKPSTDSLRLKKFLLPAAALFIVGIIVAVFWYGQSKISETSMPILSAPFASEKLSTSGKVVLAVLSPDGKTVVYTNGKDTEKESVWVRELETGNNIEIIPPSDDFYLGLAFSPDGNTLYFVRVPRPTDERPGIYRISIFGGIPQKIISDTEGWISISPDGKLISFVRQPRRDEENYSLWIADSADGRNERKLVVRPRPFRISDHEFAPDGKSIAFAAGQSENSGNEFALAEVDLETGAEREPSKERFFTIKALAWLPDKSGWLITASRTDTRNLRIWQVSARSGEAAPMTKDSQNYGNLSPDKEWTKIVSTQIEPDFDARLISLENPSASRELADANSLSFSPDGKIYFSSGMSGNEEIWSVNADGSGKRQLTNTTADESLPIPAPDGNSIIFISNRTGSAHVWRMNADGGNQTQVTGKEGGYPLFPSSDGEWVYYIHGIHRTLWRVSLKTGEEQMVLGKAKPYFALSPDASQVAYSERKGDERILTVASLADGQPVRTFPLADSKSLLLQIGWMPDGKNLAYITVNRNYGNHILWMQPLNGNAPLQIAALGDKEISSFRLAVSPDGKTFGIPQGEWLHNAVLLKGLR